MYGNTLHMTQGNAFGADLRVSEISFVSSAPAELFLLSIIEIM